MEQNDQSKIFNPKRTKKKRKYLRNNMTKAEIKLWSALKNRQLSGVKFRRQHGIGNYVVDFYCPALNLAIEVDGESHYRKSGKKHDKKRNQFLNSLNIKIIRFTNEQIFKNFDGVLKLLETEITRLKTSSKLNKIQSLGN
jgi:very-short-patch-repair endonuclease